MNTHITIEDLAVSNQAGFISPEKLSKLKRVFDAICQEAAIPLKAKEQRDELAQKLLCGSTTLEEEQHLLAFARSAVAHYRR